jgi:hypothetical protein
MSTASGTGSDLKPLADTHFQKGEFANVCNYFGVVSGGAEGGTCRRRERATARGWQTGQSMVNMHH